MRAGRPTHRLLHRRQQRLDPSPRLIRQHRSTRHSLTIAASPARTFETRPRRVLASAGATAVLCRNGKQLVSRRDASASRCHHNVTVRGPRADGGLADLQPLPTRSRRSRAFCCRTGNLRPPRLTEVVPLVSGGVFGISGSCLRCSAAHPQFDMSGRVEFQTGAVRGLDVGCTTVPIGDRLPDRGRSGFGCERVLDLTNDCGESAR